MSTTTANDTGLKHCARTQEQLDNLKKAIKKEELDYADYFFKAEDVIPARFKRHEETMREYDDLDRCRECGCTIDEHRSAEYLPATKPTACPHGIPEWDDGCDHALFFKDHFHKPRFFQQRHCNHNTLDSTSCTFDVPPNHVYGEEAHNRMLDQCWVRGYKEITLRVSGGCYKCDEGCEVTHHYPGNNLSCWVDNPDFPTKFVWIVPSEPPSSWVRWKNFYLWHAAASYLGYVLHHFGKAPDGEIRTVQESINQHVQEAKASLRQQSSVVRSSAPSSSAPQKKQNGTKRTPSTSGRDSTSKTPHRSPSSSVASHAPSNSGAAKKVRPKKTNSTGSTPSYASGSGASAARSQKAFKAPVQLFVCHPTTTKLNKKEEGTNSVVENDVLYALYACSVVDDLHNYYGNWTLAPIGTPLPLVSLETRTSPTEATESCDASQPDMGGFHDADGEYHPENALHIPSAVSEWVLEDQNRYLKSKLQKLPGAELLKQ